MEKVVVGGALGLKNILVATDYSPVSGRAIRFAASLACRFDCRLYALHAGGPVDYSVPAELWREAEEAARAAAVELGRTLHDKFPGVESEILEGAGPAWRVINNAVAEKKIDLIVLGTHGRTGVPKLLLGSEAEEILRRADCPVLCIGPNAREGEEILPAGGTVLYATDFSPEAYQAARHAYAWAGELGARLVMLHVLEDGAQLNFGRPMEPADAAKRLLERQLPPEGERQYTSELRVARGAPAEKILETAESLRAALIVIGTRAPTGIPGAATHLPVSTLHKVISQAPCAVLSAR